MRTYKEFISLVEQVSGGSLMFTRRFGSSGLPGSTGVTGNVNGGSAKGTQFSGSATGGYGTVSGQGDKINRGISASIDNSTSGGSDKDWKGVPYRTPNADTSTSTIRKGAFGSLNANVSGGAARTASKPEPTTPPVASKPGVTPKPTSKPPTAADERLMGQNTPAGAAARGRQSTFNRQNAEINGANPNASSPANVQTPYQAARARLVKAGITDEGGNEYPGSSAYLNKQLDAMPAQASSAASLGSDLRLVNAANRASREARSTGVRPVVKRSDGTYGVQ